MASFDEVAEHIKTLLYMIVYVIGKPMIQEEERQIVCQRLNFHFFFIKIKVETDKNTSTIDNKMTLDQIVRMSSIFLFAN